MALLQRGALWRDVPIVETIEGRAEFFHELDEHPRAVLRIGHIIIGRLPRPHCRAGAEGVIARAAHGVPIGDAEAQVVLHGFALDYLVGVVMLEGQRIFGIRPFVFNRLNVREKFSHGINRVRAHWRQAARASQGKVHIQSLWHAGCCESHGKVRKMDRIQPVHQILINDQDDKKLSPYVQMATESVRTKISGHHTIWGRQELEDLIRQEYGKEALGAFRKLRPYAYKANLGQYVLLHQFGGWYLDLTVRIDPIAAKINFNQEVELVGFRDLQRGSGAAHAVSTSVLWASGPGNRVFETAIEYILRNCHEEYYGVCPMSVSGPNVLGEAIALHRCNPRIIWGDFLQLTPTHKIKNPAFVFRNGMIFAWYKHSERGDLSSLGQTGTNNFQNIWQRRDVYERSGEAIDCRSVTSDNIWDPRNVRA